MARRCDRGDGRARRRSAPIWSAMPLGGDHRPGAGADGAGAARAAGARSTAGRKLDPHTRALFRYPAAPAPRQRRRTPISTRSRCSSIRRPGFRTQCRAAGRRGRSASIAHFPGAETHAKHASPRSAPSTSTSASARSPRPCCRWPRDDDMLVPRHRVASALADGLPNGTLVADGVGRPRLQRHRPDTFNRIVLDVPQELSPCKSASSCPSTTMAG